ncbi:alpha/beta fold hydrolase [Amphibacillus sp. MSJ-3]|uniref:alpha/beta hydrolase n=1 Tax=Amphibacillus sp. MSJ-3 TaxID=2841505 RepID=UPI001C0F1AFE|nr:alpha/beta fold hydrolase [Amphibacillus sp. MSJ-3]MBU5595409.1 alpha/beta fold hydrolase [Amphibacillus sp. MSJ-3]
MIGCLCIHGFTGGPYEIEPLTTYLQEKTNWLIRVPTLPGHGMNLELDKVTHEDWLESADQAYQALASQVDTVYVVGFSMGGMIAASLAAKYPVDRLVMLSPSRKYLNLIKLTSEARHLLKDRVFGEIEENLSYKNFKHKKGRIPPRAYVEFAKCMTVTRPALKEISCPVLVLQGIQDGLVPYQSTHYLAKEIPVDIDVIYYADSKHLICLGDDKEVAIEAVYQYLTDHSQINANSL